MKQDWKKAFEFGRLVVDDMGRLEGRKHMNEPNLLLLAEDCGSCSDHTAVRICDLQSVSLGYLAEDPN
jgi:hypothetical protein